MAFKLKWECEFCGTEILATRDEIINYTCSCEGESTADELCQSSMTKQERKERYKRQYKENGYSWLGKKPWMWEGDLN